MSKLTDFYAHKALLQEEGKHTESLTTCVRGCGKNIVAGCCKRRFATDSEPLPHICRHIVSVSLQPRAFFTKKLGMSRFSSYLCIVNQNKQALSDTTRINQQEY